MRSPAALHVLSRPASTAGTGHSGSVIFVHGSLDRAESFRRVMRRLPELTTIAYDRRGYQGSRTGGVVGLAGHADDLLSVADDARAVGTGPLVAVGHSLGGDVVVAAALAEPTIFGAIGAYEPPMPWLGFRRGGSTAGSNAGTDADAGAARPWPLLADDPGDEAESFFCRMVGPSAWARLSEQGRAERRADGPALVADLRSFRSDTPPFDVTALDVPTVFGMGGRDSAPHHRRTVQWLGAHVPGALVHEIAGAQHGAHLSHPDHFASFARLVMERAMPRDEGGWGGWDGTGRD
jgi:pimeloyl-ACP methyl ester carboxylesterase